MATMRKEEQCVKASETTVTAASGNPNIMENAKSSFKRPHVNEQVRKELMEKYKYGDKYHD